MAGVISAGSLVEVSDLWDEELDTWVDCPPQIGLVIDSQVDENENNMLFLYVPGAPQMEGVPYYSSEVVLLWNP